MIDINTPLTVVQQIIEMLERGAGSGPVEGPLGLPICGVQCRRTGLTITSGLNWYQALDTIRRVCNDPQHKLFTIVITDTDTDTNNAGQTTCTRIV